MESTNFMVEKLGYPQIRFGFKSCKVTLKIKTTLTFFKSSQIELNQINIFEVKDKKNN